MSVVSSRLVEQHVLAAWYVSKPAMLRSDCRHHDDVLMSSRRLFYDVGAFGESRTGVADTILRSLKYRISSEQ